MYQYTQDFDATKAAVQTAIFVRPCVGMVVTNQTSQSVLATADNGYSYLVPAGSVIPFNVPVPTLTMRIQMLVASSGTLTLAAQEDPYPPSATASQVTVIGGTVTITGTPTFNLAPGGGITIVNSSPIATNTPDAIVASAALNNNNAAIVTTRKSELLTLSLEPGTMTRGGLLSFFSSTPAGDTVYYLLGYCFQTDGTPLYDTLLNAWRFPTDIPANSIIAAIFTGHATFVVGY